MSDDSPGRSAEHTAVIGVVPGRAEAARAVADLRAAGFHESQLGVLGRDDRGRPVKVAGGDVPDPAEPAGTQWEEGAGVGAAAGAATGLGLGLAVAAGLMPPIGPVVAGGTLVALLASAGAGAAAGTLAGGVIGFGVPEADAARYAADVDAGRVLVVVERADARAAEALAIVRRYTVPKDAGSPVGVYGAGLPATPY